MKCLKPKDLGCVIVDTTVQENGITFPTDPKLYAKGIELLVREAKRAGMKLKRTYARTVPALQRASCRNFLKGRIGDEINALMASFAHNRKKTLNRLRIFVQIYLKAENPAYTHFVTSQEMRKIYKLTKTV